MFLPVVGNKRPVPRLGAEPAEDAMPNEPEPAARKRTPPKDRQNAQGDHEGSPHRPDEFDAANPAKQVPRRPDAPRKGES